MHNIILILFLSVPLTVSISLEYSRLIDPFSAVQNPCTDVRNGQFICEDCGTLSFCMQQNGAWTTLKIADCQTEHSLYCDEEARGCVFKQSCKEISMNPKFECQNPGVFPDPYDCKYYHICNDNNQDERRICPMGMAYSPASKTCSLTTNADICLKAQYECNGLGEMAAWPTDPSIYYVCHVRNVADSTIYYPVLYHCQIGYVYEKNSCVRYIAPTTAPSPAPTAVPPEINSCQAGSDLIPHPSDCYSYFICSNEILVSLRCPAGTRFNLTTKSCVFGKC